MTYGEAERLLAPMPLYARRCCAIILGELLPERWRHRMASSPDHGAWGRRGTTQIDKAPHSDLALPLDICACRQLVIWN